VRVAGGMLRDAGPATQETVSDTPADATFLDSTSPIGTPGARPSPSPLVADESEPTSTPPSRRGQTSESDATAAAVAKASADASQQGSDDATGVADEQRGSNRAAYFERSQRAADGSALATGAAGASGPAGGAAGSASAGAGGVQGAAPRPSGLGMASLLPDSPASVFSGARSDLPEAPVSLATVPPRLRPFVRDYFTAIRRSPPQ
jgi:hypothetical protein